MNSDGMERYLVNKAAKMGQPIKATLELTPLCNMNCEMCYIRHSAQEVRKLGGLKPVKFWKSLIPQMKKMGVLFVALIGGEPLLYNGFRELYEDLSKEGFFINLTTNATLINDEMISWLREMPPRYITISVYGASNDTYAKVTGNSKGFTQMSEALEKLLSAGFNVKLNFTCTPHNYHDLDEVFALQKKYNIPLLASAYSFPAMRRKDNCVTKRLSARLCAQCQMHINELSMDADGYYEYCRKITENGFSYNAQLHREEVPCHAGRSNFWMDWQGNMMPCGLIKGYSVTYNGDNLDNCWDAIKKNVSGIRMPEKCSKCNRREFCQVCAASMMIEKELPEGDLDYLCEMTCEMKHIAEMYVNERRSLL